MGIPRSVRIGAALFAILACDSPVQPKHASGRGFRATTAVTSAQGVVRSATGGGHYLLAGLYDAELSFTAHARADGTADGQFRQFVSFPTGTVDISGEVTCMSVDLANGHAWIGGVVKSNNSTDPSYIDPITEPGQDVWFRVLDSGEGQSDPDRTTFLGFVGVIPSSEEYCATQPWAAGNARTHPFTAGNIQVHD